MTEAPFVLARNGWAPFELEVDIEFQDWTRLKPIKGILHQLVFKPNGRYKIIQVAIDDIPGVKKKEKLED